MCQPALQGDDDGLSAVGYIEAHENDADVGFDGGFLDMQFLCDFTIASTSYEERQDLALAGAEVGAGHALGQNTRHGRRNKAAACMNLAQCIDEGFMRHPFDEVAAGTGFEGLMDIFIAFISGENDEAGLGSEASDFANRFHSAAIGQA